MEAVKELIAYIAGEWAVIASAPVTFVTAVAMVSVVIWYFAGSKKRGEIDALKATMALKDERIALSKDTLEHSQRRLGKLEKELENLKAAVASADSDAMRRHSLAASTIAADVRMDVESTAAALAATSGFVQPVLFGSAKDTKDEDE